MQQNFQSSQNRDEKLCNAETWKEISVLDEWHPLKIRDQQTEALENKRFFSGSMSFCSNNYFFMELPQQLDVHDCSLECSA